MIFALTLDGHEEMSPREVSEEEKKKPHSFGSSKSLSCSTVADEEAYLSDFPFPFQVFIFESAPELLSPVLVECLFW